jgi:hypothetical protein
MAKGNIKSGGGANIRSAVYPSMGGLKSKPRGVARPKPFRGEKQRSTGR